MYFTIPQRDASSPSLSPDARGSYHALRVQANALAGFSASFAHEANEVAASYQAALADGTTSAWRAFVERCQSLVNHCDSVDAVVGFNAVEHDAWQFFAQITDENRDLLELAVYAAA